MIIGHSFGNIYNWWAMIWLNDLQLKANGCISYPTKYLLNEINMHYPAYCNARQSIFNIYDRKIELLAVREPFLSYEKRCYYTETVLQTIQSQKPLRFPNVVMHEYNTLAYLIYQPISPMAGFLSNNPFSGLHKNIYCCLSHYRYNCGYILMYHDRCGAAAIGKKNGGPGTITSDLWAHHAY